MRRTFAPLMAARAPDRTSTGHACCERVCCVERGCREGVLEGCAEWGCWSGMLFEGCLRGWVRGWLARGCVLEGCVGGMFVRGCVSEGAG